MPKPGPLLTCENVVCQLIHDIEISGGVWKDKLGNFHPVADPTWTDLGATYIHACKSVRKQPLIVREGNHA